MTDKTFIPVHWSPFRTNILDAEFAYSPSTFAVGMRWSEDQSFGVFNVFYPMYGHNDDVTDWVSVGKGIGGKKLTFKGEARAM